MLVQSTVSVKAQYRFRVTAVVRILLFNTHAKERPKCSSTPAARVSARQCAVHSNAHDARCNGLRYVDCPCNLNLGFGKRSYLPPSFTTLFKHLRAYGSPATASQRRGFSIKLQVPQTLASLILYLIILILILVHPYPSRNLGRVRNSHVRCARLV